MTPCEIFIRQYIKEHGPITIATYMGTALTHPEFGFYMTRDPFGTGGHFTTAPEISQLFGELIGLWAADQWTQMGSPSAVALLELGPGRGTLMKDFLRAARVRPDFLKAVRLHLVEISPVLTQLQYATLSTDCRFEHHSSLSETLKRFHGLPLIVIGNEYFDALPLHQYEKIDGVWKERNIALGDSREKASFCFTTALLQNSFAFPDAPDGSVYEINPHAIEEMNTLASYLQAFGGAGLFIDYGYEGPAFGDTFQAVYRHQFYDPLKSAGLADLTAHVDFTPLMKVIRNHPPLLFQFITQGTFLKALGIDLRLDHLCRQANERQKETLRSEADRLTNPDHMGTLFKVLEIRNLEKIHG